MSSESGSGPSFVMVRTLAVGPASVAARRSASRAGLRHFTRARLYRWGTLLLPERQQGAPPAPGQGPKFMIAGTFQDGLQVRYRHVIWARALSLIRAGRTSLIRAGRTGAGIGTTAARDEAAVLEASGRLTDRDRELIRLIARLRVLTTGHLAALGFSSAITAGHRLALLIKLGMLHEPSA
ncbi:MAG TPA: hypothetical protein VFQ44_13870 [Streptosporangiaceae bacterium]|nr:hypothetical protein [Streptosporangiaceae bacterium]